MARGLKKIVRSDVSDYSESDVVPLNPVEAAPQSVGELLRTKREEFSVDLREASEYLRIRYAYLLAIEEGRVDDLPGATYAMGFVRAYADYLGLDGPAVVERYKDETAELSDDVRLVFPSPLPEGKVPSGAIIMIAVSALILVYVGWVVFAQQNVKIAELVPALPESIASLLGSGEPATAEIPAKPPTASEESVPQASKTAPPPAAVSEPQPAELKPIEVPATEAVSPRAEPAEPAPSATPSESSAVPDAVATTPQNMPAQTTQTAAEPRRSEAAPSVVAAAMSPANAGEQATTREEPPLTTDDAISRVSETATRTNNLTQVVDAALTEPVATPADIAAADAPQTRPDTTAQDSERHADQPTVSADQVAVASVPVDRQDAATLPPKPPAVASAEPRQYGSDNTDSRVMIKARIDSWVEIRDSDGEKLLTRVLRAGDSFRVPDKLVLLMETGNAGGLEITVDGEVIPDIGPKGAVRREVALDAESLKSRSSR